MKIKIALSLLILSLVFSPSLTFVVAEEDSTQDNESKQQNNDTKSTPKISSNKRSEVKTLEEFIPSEEVSADKPISFPSDI